MIIRISKEGKLFIHGRYVGEINQTLLDDEEVKRDVRRLLIKERSQWLARVRADKNIRRYHV